MDTALFDAVQAKLSQNLNRRDLRKGKSGALLTGCLFDERGNLMSPSHAVKKGVRYRYYVSTAAVQGRKADAGSVARVPAAEIEALVLAAMQQHLIDKLPEEDAIARRALCRQIDLRVSVGSQALVLTWNDPVDEQLDSESESPSGSAQRLDDRLNQHVNIPYVFNAHKGRRDIVLPATTSSYLRPIENREQQSLTCSLRVGAGSRRSWPARASPPSLHVRAEASA